MSVNRYPNAYDMLDMNTSYRNSTAHPFSFMPAFRVLREKATTAGMQEVEQRMEQLPRMRGVRNQAVISFRSPLPNPLPEGEGVNGTAAPPNPWKKQTLLVCLPCVSVAIIYSISTFRVSAHFSRYPLATTGVPRRGAYGRGSSSRRVPWVTNLSVSAV